jgi:plasmid stability protein
MPVGSSSGIALPDVATSWGRGPRVLASYAYIAYNTCMQYTIRKVPNSLDAALRRRAHEQGKSLNEVAIEALARGAGVSEERCRQRDLHDIAGTWLTDRAFERALAAQDTVDKELWR